MASVTIGFAVTNPLQTREILGRTEKVYDIVVTGAVTLTLALTPTEFKWKRQQLIEDLHRLEHEIRRDKNQLNPQDTAVLEAEMKTIQKYLLVAEVLVALAPGGLLT